jgi:hypothetical protein
MQQRLETFVNPKAAVGRWVLRRLKIDPFSRKWALNPVMVVLSTVFNEGVHREKFD